MENGLLIAIIVNLVGISLAVWFLTARVKAKLAEVEARKAGQREDDSA